MKKFLLIIGILVSHLCFGQIEALNKSVVVTTVYQNNVGPFRADGGAVSVHYMEVMGHSLYILRVGSTSQFDDATAVILGDNLEDSLEWLDAIVRVCEVFDVGTFMCPNTVLDWMPEPTGLMKQAMNHTVMIGDKHFSGLGELNERGSSIVFVPDNSLKTYGRHGVHKGTFKKLRKQLAREARRGGLK